MKPRAILETILYAEDIAAMDAFYGGVLGLERHWIDEDKTVMFRLGDAMLLIFNPRATRQQTLDADPPIPAHGASGAGHVCFRATRAEIDVWRRHLIAEGIEIESEFDWPGSRGHSLYFRDPAGNSVEFAEASIWGLDDGSA